MDVKRDGRRRFLKNSVAVGLAAGTLPVVNAQDTVKAVRGSGYDTLSEYGVRSSYDTSQRGSDLGQHCGFAGHCNSLTPLQDQPGIITASPLHFVGTHGAYPPDINPDEHELVIHGLVDRPLKFSMAELKRLPSISRIHFIECSANFPLPQDETVQQTHGKVACSEWTGVPLSLLLDEVGVKSDTKWVVAEGLDRAKHTKSIPIKTALDHAFVAYGQNGELIYPHQGFPLRLMVPGFGGFAHVKWLHRLKLVDKPYLSPSDRFDGRLGPKSVVTFPSGGQKLSEHGYYTITGFAWSGAGAIRSVEVSTDSGRSWQAADINGQILPMALTRFSLGWNWDGKATTIMSRSTDDKGQVQPMAADIEKTTGAPVDFREYRNAVGVWDLVFPWRVASDGSVKQEIWG